MIKDSFEIWDWNITILYECTCNDINIIIETLKDIYCPKKYIKEAVSNLERCNLNTGLTYSNLKLRSSVIVISKTSSVKQLINTISHEYYHLLCHISVTLEIKDEEKLATLCGDLNMHSYKVVEDLIKGVGSE